MSGKYLAGRNAFAAGNISWPNDMILAQLVSASYRFNEDHRLGDLTGIVGEPIELSEKDIADGWLTAANIRFQQVRGEEVVAIVFHNGNVPIEYHDAIDNFPLHPNGGDIEISIQQPGIFRI